MQVELFCDYLAPVLVGLGYRIDDQKAVNSYLINHKGMTLFLSWMECLSIIEAKIHIVFE